MERKTIGKFIASLRKANGYIQSELAEILAYKSSLSLEEQFVLDTVNQLITDNKAPITENTTLHSDQGCHYIAIAIKSY